MINLEIPDDLQPYLRELQGVIKAEKGVGFYSLQKCIISIIREHKTYTENQKNIRPETPDPRPE